MDKTTRYDWAMPGDPGRPVNLPIGALLVDHSYQRDEVSEANTLAIAKSFSWSAFGILVVMQRDDGSIFIVDGQQRWLAAIRRGDITLIPCLLFKSRGPEHEAQAFIALNLRRVPVRAVAKFNAAVMAAQQPETEIAAWLKEQGFIMSSHQAQAIDFPHLMVSTWKEDAAACREAVIVQSMVNAGEPMHCNIHKGLWYLIHQRIGLRAHVEHLRRQGGRTALLQAIRVVMIELQQNPSIRICGSAVLRLINKGRRGRRIALPEAGA